MVTRFAATPLISFFAAEISLIGDDGTSAVPGGPPIMGNPLESKALPDHSISISGVPDTTGLGTQHNTHPYSPKVDHQRGVRGTGPPAICHAALLRRVMST